MTKNEFLSFSDFQNLPHVYFNFQKRQLKYADNSRVSPVDFLNFCRTINDSAIQAQVARYDAYTKDKHKLGLVGLGSGLAAFSLITSASAYAGQGNDIMTSSLAFFGVLGVLMIPVTAIASSIPHQKRKEVLFRDLPIAYNRYVETKHCTTNN
jgi:hypothetical protein